MVIRRSGIKALPIYSVRWDLQLSLIHISYANCGLPYYIGDVITDPEELTLQTPESFFKRFRINMKIHHEVISIHPERKKVSVKNLENGEIFEEKYDKLILSPGAKPTQMCIRDRIHTGTAVIRTVFFFNQIINKIPIDCFINQSQHMVLRRCV